MAPKSPPADPVLADVSPSPSDGAFRSRPAAAPGWSELGRRAQVARLRHLAQACLPRFGVPLDAKITLLDHLENSTFRVRAIGGAGSFVLRIHRHGKHSDSELCSELAWLESLATETGLRVPLPIRTVEGDLLARLTHPAVPESRACSLLRWVDGCCLSRPGVPYFTKLGRFTAALHRHGREWRPSEPFRRWSWDTHGLLGPGANLGDGDPSAVLDAAAARALEDARAAIRSRLAEHGTREEYGLIHSDLHRWNVLNRGDQVGAIDFDDCGFGWYLYDAAVALMDWQEHAQFPRFLDAYRAGYEEIRSLSGLDAHSVRAFALARTLAGLGWLATRRDVAAVQAHTPRALADAVRKARAYLSSR